MTNVDQITQTNWQEITSISISILAFVWSFVNWMLTSRNSKENIRLETHITNVNNQRHWRREKIYNLADELYDVACDYWLSDGDDLSVKKNALNIKIKLSDLEDNANALNIDIKEEIESLRDIITGGDFESTDRKIWSTDSEKFLMIRLHTQSIKSKLT